MSGAGGGGGGGGSGDSKLCHLVRKFLSFSVDEIPNADHIVHCLRTQHREYQRKDLGKLKRQVQKILKKESDTKEGRGANSSGGGGNGNGNGSSSAASGGQSPLKKRSLEEAREDHYEKKARQHDMQRSMQLNTGGGGFMNAGLRERYKTIQQDRDSASRAEAAAMAAAEAKAMGEVQDAAAVGAAKATSENNSTSMNSHHHNSHHHTTTTSTTSTNTTKDNHPSSSHTPNAKQQQPPVHPEILADTPSLASSTKSVPPPTPSSSSKALKRKKSASKKASFSSSHGSTLGGGGGGTPGRANSENNFTMFTMAVSRPKERYADLGGMIEILTQIRQLLEYPLARPELYRHLGVDPPRGVLLRGPPGCGKTHLANAIAGQLGVSYFRVSAPELVSGMSGESEGRIRDLFQAASDSAPAIVFLDELDAIAPKRSDSGSSRGMEKRMVAQLLTCMDQLDPQYNRNTAPVLVLGATNRPDSIDPALRRAGRFDKEIVLGMPDEEARIGILKTMTKGMKLSGDDFDFKLLARKTPGFVGADIRSLTKEAAVIAINRIFQDVLKDQSLSIAPADVDEGTTSESGSMVKRDGVEGIAAPNANNEEMNATSIMTKLNPLTEEEMEPLNVTMEDFLSAVPKVQPSSKREGFAEVPDVTWDDVGALGSIREELTLSVLEPIRNPEKFQALGIPLPAGVMLYGPPGCGKTLLAKAIASESGANFISVKGPSLLDKFVGESERSVRLLFERARSSSPCIVFFDELDSLCPKRGSDSGGGGVSERVVNQLLTEMDGLESRRSVFVIAATNRPELIDPAMMRPGRLDKLVYVPLPTPTDRVSVLRALSGKVKLGTDVDLHAIGCSPRADGYSGADCAALLREAGLAVLKEGMDRMVEGDTMEVDGDVVSSSLCITARHFEYAFNHVMPSVSRKDQARYDRMRDRMARARSRGSVSPGEEGTEPLETLVDGEGALTVTTNAKATKTSHTTDSTIAGGEDDGNDADAAASLNSMRGTNRSTYTKDKESTDSGDGKSATTTKTGTLGTSHQNRNGDGDSTAGPTPQEKPIADTYDLAATQGTSKQNEPVKSDPLPDEKGTAGSYGLAS